MNKEVKLYFRKPGLLSLIQDQGRSGYQAYGVPVGGVLDRAAARQANQLVGNPLGAPVLELTLIGPEIEIHGQCQMAVCGADLSPMLNEKSFPQYETVDVKKGDLLRFGRARKGCRAYLAIGGRWEVKKWLKSCSAAAQNGQLLTPDSIIQKEHFLYIVPAPFVKKKEIGPKEWPVYPTKQKIRVLPGPEFESFSPYAIGFFFSRSYKITPDSNRMGYRLEGTIVDFKPEKEVLSSGIVPGTIQVTNAGQPIVLLADAQTTGGYPRLANVIDADLDKLAQLKPGDEIRFSLIPLEEAKHLFVNRV